MNKEEDHGKGIDVWIPVGTFQQSSCPFSGEGFEYRGNSEAVSARGRKRRQDRVFQRLFCVCGRSEANYVPIKRRAVLGSEESFSETLQGL